VITYNRILNSGYDGINWKGIDGDISFNYINGACQVLDDGGGIYTYNGSDRTQAGSAGSKVTYNIVLNVTGTRKGYTKKYDAGHGIYMDNSIHDTNIKYNTVHGCFTGVFLH
jgi:nitrous oxidase accessory protein NosD